MDIGNILTWYHLFIKNTLLRQNEKLMMDLEKLICRAPGTNSAFTLPNAITLDVLIEKCKLIGKTGYINLAQVDMGSLSDQFSEFEIIVLTNVESINEHHELLYRLSCLLDFEEPYVLCVVSDINKFNKLQHNKAGPLYLRLYWINDFGIFLPQLRG